MARKKAELAEDLARAKNEPVPAIRSAKMFEILSKPPFCNTSEEFARMFLKIVNKEGNLDWFRYNRAQQRVDAMLVAQVKARRPRRLVAPKARQEGVSTYAEGLIFGSCAKSPHKSGLIIAHKKQSSSYIFNMSRRFLEHMPYSRPTKYSSKLEIVWASPHGSALAIETAENRDAGRGMTPQYVHCSEVAFWPDAVRTMSGFLPGVPKTPDSLVILESTGNGVGDWFYDTCMAANKGKSQFELCFLPWHDHEEYQMEVPEDLTWKAMDLNPAEVILREKFGLTKERIQWRRWMILEMGGNMDKFHQEYPATLMECFLSTGRPVFRAKKVSDAMDGKMAPIFKGSIQLVEGRAQIMENLGGQFRVWSHPDPSKRYVMGVDTGLGYATSDNGVAQVLDAITGDQVAELSGKWDSKEFGAMCVAIGLHYNNAFMAVEVNNNGLFIIDVIRQLGYWNLMHRESYDPTMQTPMKKVGWQTSVKTRPVLVDFAVQMFHADDAPRVHSEELLNQMAEFQFQADGKPSVPTGKHDDELLSWMIALQAFKWHVMSKDLTPPPKQYTGEDAWAWKSVQAHITTSQKEKRRNGGEDLVRHMKRRW